jgi:hypothetical protein
VGTTSGNRWLGFFGEKKKNWIVANNKEVAWGNEFSQKYKAGVEMGE